MLFKTALGAIIAALMLSRPSFAWIPEPYSATYMVFFTQPNSATPTGRAVENLQRIASEANNRLDGPIDVTGYADAEEADVSKARAEAVKARLVELGVAPSRISVKWRGSQGRLVLNPPGVPEAQNRRVEINMEALCVRTQSCPEATSQDAGSSRD